MEQHILRFDDEIDWELLAQISNSLQRDTLEPDTSFSFPPSQLPFEDYRNDNIVANDYINSGHEFNKNIASDGEAYNDLDSSSQSYHQDVSSGMHADQSMSTFVSEHTYRHEYIPGLGIYNNPIPNHSAGYNPNPSTSAFVVPGVSVFALDNPLFAPAVPFLGQEGTEGSQDVVMPNTNTVSGTRGTDSVDVAGEKLLRSALNSRDLANIAGPYTNMPVDIDLTTIEILTFLPGLIYDLKFVERLMNGGWTNHMVTHAINTVRDWGVDSAGIEKKFSRTIVTSLTKRAMISITGDIKWAERRWRTQPDLSLTPTTDFTAKNFLAAQLARDKKDVLISSLADNVRHFPLGDDRGTLTEVIELVQALPQLDRPLSELNSLLEYVTVITYDLATDQRCQARWSAEAAKTKVRFYDITNQYKLEGAVRPPGLEPPKRKGKLPTTTSSAKKAPKRKRSSDVDETGDVEDADNGDGTDVGNDVENDDAPRPRKRTKKGKEKVV